MGWTSVPECPWAVGSLTLVKGVLLRVLLGVLLMATAGAFGAWAGGAGGANIAGLAVMAVLIYLAVTCPFLLVRRRSAQRLRKV